MATTGDNKKYKVIGTRPIRHDGADKVTGRAIYGADVQLAGMVHGKILRSPHAHARIKSIDTKAAEKLPGVLAVVTAADLPNLKDKIADLGEGSVNLAHLGANVLAHDKVLYKGHAVAAVAATSPHVAEEAVKLIKVEYEPLPAVTWVLDAMKDDAPLLHDDVRHQLDGQEGNEAQQRRHAPALREREARRGLRQGRRRGRARVQDRQRPPGLHRAARLDGAVERGRPPDHLDHHARLVHGPPANGRAAADSRLAGHGGAVRDRRRLRRQDRGLSRAGGGAS